MNAWPMYATSAVRQWSGLPEAMRTSYEEQIRKRDTTGISGCILGIYPDSAEQREIPIWSVDQHDGLRILRLVSIKIELVRG